VQHVVEPELAVARLRVALEDAIALKDPAVGRLRHSRTSVRFAVGRESVVLLLDRDPVAVGGSDEPAEIEIVLDAAQADRLAHGQLSIVEGLIAGEVGAHGPVRRYMEVDPILRHLLDVATADAPRPGHSPSIARSAPVDPDHLAIETRGLDKSFGANRVLHDCNLQIPEGVISVILGPSGTGKSVMLQHLIGLLTPDGGDVLIRGRRLSTMSRSEVLGLRRAIGVMFQDGALFSTMNVFDNVAFPLRQHTNLSELNIRRVVKARLAEVGLLEARARMPGELSGGMRKRAGLARALVLEPGIVLCDEPDSGLDPVRTSLLGDLLVQQHAAYGGTMVVVTHNVALAEQIADHVSVLWQGRVLESGLAREIFASESEFVRQFLTSETVGPLSMDA
jgi:phospholipid/cholesterol/gamma-HCH transport system ATP-binding protein